MRNWKYIALATIGGLSVFTTTAGAAGGNGGYTNSATSIQANQSQTTKIQKLDQIDNRVGLGWFGENKIIVSKQNENMSALNWGGISHYPDNIYIHDLVTGTDKPLIESENQINYPVISPDQNNIIYGIVDGWYMYNIKSGKTVKAAGPSEGKVLFGSWMDSNQFVYPNMEGNIVGVNTNGKSEILVKTGKRIVTFVTGTGSMIYYTYSEGPGAP